MEKYARGTRGEKRDTKLGRLQAKRNQGGL
jgi:hypothetical protein